METVPRHLDALLLDPWFSQLPVPLRKQIVAMGILRKAVPRQKLFERGESNTGVFCLLEGTVLVMNEAEPGMEGVLVHFDAPAWFGEIGLFDGGPHTHTVLAATSCSVLYLPRTLVLQLLERTPEYWQHFSMLLTAKLRLAFFAFDEFAKMPLEVRLARRLLMKAAGMGASKVYSPTLDVHQEEFAQTMGIGRSSLNPLLQRMAKQGLVRVQYGRVTIVDLDGLKKLAGFDRWHSAYRDLLAAPIKAKE